MADDRKLAFAPFATPDAGVLIVFCEEGLKFGSATRKALAPADAQIKRAAEGEKFTGKSGSILDIAAPTGLKVARLVVIGAGKGGKLKSQDYVKLGGIAMGKVPSRAAAATIFAEFAGGSLKPDQAAELALGTQLRAYVFDRYKTKRKEGEEAPEKPAITIAVANASQAKKAWEQSREPVADGVIMARDLINEPANVLYPDEFAKRCGALRKLGVTVEVLDVPAMKKLGMNALLGVGQGSRKDSRVVIMRWNGGKKKDAPVAFIGKGVCFDTGGISIKPASGMEDMKGDMAGAACVVGLMHALAARKAKVNAVGAIGCVENMPDGNAQRPGDIVKTMNGQTIEIINTDAEGRLVLADVLHYVNTRDKPKFMIDLATLTGAIIVALGQEYAGMFGNDDRLCDRLTRAGQDTMERVWRMPLGPEYDKQIDSKFADMKNTGGRWGGSITAAQLLARFVDKTPWVHLDIAGTALGSPQTDINKSWSSGWGVRLLNQLVEDHYER
ncbi:leucyl aminopeptidase [Rhodoplanes sp. Z2-YC6860]|uniref:leucyl aminopeptidase n=1 Tax=Rhodoplanes sp. Z2-YC6860 TaxID=674703 RepID=UPI00078CDA3A|nr:leucyl aminopeptidase [Rhodoplanes sp. Z2-YC6860]AMN42907.1 cytosol aminopeptidase [Rhodoplanes sp. Z2-YC6860]